MMPYQWPRRGPSARLPQTLSFSFIQNHDQIGNGRLANGSTRWLPWKAIRALRASTPRSQIPMLVMGAEWGATQPFRLFLRLTGT